MSADRITMILRSAGFVTSDLIGGRNAVNFACILHLRGRAENMAAVIFSTWVRELMWASAPGENQVSTNGLFGLFLRTFI